MSTQIKRSVSLYSYQEEFYTGKMTLEDCIRAASEAGATGIEFCQNKCCLSFRISLMSLSNNGMVG